MKSLRRRLIAPLAGVSWLLLLSHAVLAQINFPDTQIGTTSSEIVIPGCCVNSSSMFDLDFTLNVESPNFDFVLGPGSQCTDGTRLSDQIMKILGPDASCQLTIQFDPRTVGQKTGKIIYSYNGTIPFTSDLADLIGTGVNSPPRPPQLPTVLSISGTPQSFLPIGASAGAVSWSSVVAYDNVTVTAGLMNFSAISITCHAWITTDLGPSANTSSVVAATQFTLNPTGDFPNFVNATLFTNLHLGAGTYYLVITADDSKKAASWADPVYPLEPSPPTLIAASGVNYINSWASLSSVNTFPPSRPFFTENFFLFALTGTPSPISVQPKGVVPIGSSSTVIQPGSWVSIYGTNMANGTYKWNGDFPASLGGTSVTVNTKPAYLWFVSPTQINLQLPDDNPTGLANVVVKSPTGSAVSTATFGVFGPSFNLLDDRHVAGIILRYDGSGTSGGGSYDILGPTGTSLGYKTVAARAGDTLELFGVGFGPTNPTVPAGQVFVGSAPTTNTVQLLINGTAVSPSYSGLTSAGLYQFNVVVPAGLGAGDLSLQASVGGFLSTSGVVLSLQ